jgi:hypothetical protein
LLFLGQVGTLGFSAIVILLLLLAPWDIGSYSIGNEAVSGPEFLRRGGLLFGAVGGLFLAIGVGLWLDRAWTRPLMLAYWPLIALLGFVMPDTSAADAIEVAVFAGVGFAFAAGYLYGTDGVKAYYAARTRTPPPVSDADGAH